MSMVLSTLPETLFPTGAVLSTKNADGGYGDNTVLSNEGFGDTGLNTSGSGDDVAAVWSRITKKPSVTEPGQSVTTDTQVEMMNSSDIMIAVPDGNGGWSVTNLTEGNGVADLFPVVSRQGDRIFVAWRQVASSNATDVTDFNTKDMVYYRVSEDEGKTWSKASPIVNGTSGTIMGLETAMLDDGTAAIAFIIQGENHNLTTGSYNQNVGYAIVGKNKANAYDVLRHVVMEDNELSENTQLAAVSLDSQTIAFVIGWHSMSASGNNDIRLAAVDRNGNRIVGFVDSLSSLTANSGVNVSSDFQIVAIQRALMICPFCGAKQSEILRILPRRRIAVSPVCVSVQHRKTESQRYRRLRRKR